MKNAAAEFFNDKSAVDHAALLHLSLMLLLLNRKEEPASRDQAPGTPRLTVGRRFSRSAAGTVS